MERATRMLMAAHPTSVVAHTLLAEIYERDGREPEAVAALERALAILRQGADQLYLESSARRERVSLWVDSIRGQLAALRR